MKHVVAVVLLAWGAMMLEQARPDLLPTDTLILPLIAVSMLWSGRAGGILTSGALLLVDGIIRPQPTFLLPIMVALAATMILSLRGRTDPWRSQRRGRLPMWAQPVLLVAVGAATLYLPSIFRGEVSVTTAGTALQQFAIIAVPLSLLLTGLMKLAGEFGLRRST